jgi:DNA-binding response OmpR family regulator
MASGCASAWIRPNVPIIMLTARGEAGQVLGLELGADDYICEAVSIQSSSRVRAP